MHKGVQALWLGQGRGGLWGKAHVAVNHWSQVQGKGLGDEAPEAK
jgi:hypothetical protein